MIQKENIEALLKINGVPPGAPDDEIRSVLLSARYNKDEIDTAVMVLRENSQTHQTRVEGLHKVFRTDKSLNPSEISALLGIDVNISEVQMVHNQVRRLTWWQVLFITLVASLIALSGILVAMYVTQVGLFHPSVTALRF